MALASFFVPGRPRTKGSLKVITPRGRKPILVEDHEYSEPWRRKIVSIIRAKIPAVNLASHEPYSGPVVVWAYFRFDQNGKTAQEHPYPTVNAGVNANGDLDKLVRNLLDALTDSRLIRDDSQVVRLSAGKCWATEQDQAGVSVLVEAV